MPQLDAHLEDTRIAKTHANSFYQTDLTEHLKQEQIDCLEVWGAQTQYCVDSTIKFAHGLGFTLYSFPNASSTTDQAACTALQIIAFYEDIWRDRFLTFEDPLIKKEFFYEHLSHN